MKPTHFAYHRASGSSDALLCLDAGEGVHNDVEMSGLEHSL